MFVWTCVKTDLVLSYLQGALRVRPLPSSDQRPYLAKYPHSRPLQAGGS